MTVERETCVACADEAVAAAVLAIVDGDAIVDTGERHERVAIDLVPDALPGDLLLCHAGIALLRLEEPAS